MVADVDPSAYQAISFNASASGGATATNRADISDSVSRGRKMMLRPTARPDWSDP